MDTFLGEFSHESDESISVHIVEFTKTSALTSLLLSRGSPSGICQLGFYFCRKKENSECTQDFNFSEEVVLFSELNLRGMRHTLAKLNVSP